MLRYVGHFGVEETRLHVLCQANMVCTGHVPGCSLYRGPTGVLVPVCLQVLCHVIS
jgi:hypothetical protein